MLLSLCFGLRCLGWFVNGSGALFEARIVAPGWAFGSEGPGFDGYARAIVEEGVAGGAGCIFHADGHAGT